MNSNDNINNINDDVNDMIKTKRQKRQELSKELFDDSIRGQKLTSPNKNYVYIPLDEQYVGYVYKGPFTKTEKRNRVLTFRIEMFTLLESKNVLIPTKIIQEKDDWFRYPFLGDIHTIDYEEKMINDKPIKFLKRVNLRLVDLKPKDLEDIIFGEDMFIYSILDAIILKVGDMGPHNMLQDLKGKPYIIDIEDSSGQTIKHAGNLFRMDVAKYTNIILHGYKRDGIKEKVIHFLQQRKIILKDYIDLFQKELKYNPIELIDHYLSLLDEI
jgi:hypothetical protein